ncbi:hypothetical protein [Polymorphobacter megasporae]|uniref:hypothetical protein n=1 Tax=Glacieibacterium megasporae TaxID=2835787 RepID=UPI001C1E7D1B|nr:hypothetical protein [Polymorphobacter megasporae]UAJ10103.1 hypothetical protein KTC28_17815 [Polymorphobacter megasporae]
MTARAKDPAAPTDAKAKAAVKRAAAGSVTEAIGKLIGDDAVRERGTAEKKAGAADASGRKTSPRS